MRPCSPAAGQQFGAAGCAGDAAGGCEGGHGKGRSAEGREGLDGERLHGGTPKGFETWGRWDRPVSVRRAPGWGGQGRRRAGGRGLRLLHLACLRLGGRGRGQRGGGGAGGASLAGAMHGTAACLCVAAACRDRCRHGTQADPREQRNRHPFAEDRAKAIHGRKIARIRGARGTAPQQPTRRDGQAGGQAGHPSAPLPPALQRRPRRRGHAGRCRQASRPRAASAATQRRSVGVGCLRARAGSSTASTKAVSLPRRR